MPKKKKKKTFAHSTSEVFPHLCLYFCESDDLFQFHIDGRDVNGTDDVSYCGDVGGALRRKLKELSEATRGAQGRDRSWHGHKGSPLFKDRESGNASFLFTTGRALYLRRRH